MLDMPFFSDGSIKERHVSRCAASRNSLVKKIFILENLPFSAIRFCPRGQVYHYETLNSYLRSNWSLGIVP